MFIIMIWINIGSGKLVTIKRLHSLTDFHQTIIFHPQQQCHEIIPVGIPWQKSKADLTVISWRRVAT